MLDFEEALRALGKKVSTLDKNILEEQTKQTLILPFIQALGYDVFNLNEVVTEFTASTASLKDARADFAIMKDGQPVIVMECKALSEKLDRHKTQLEWYFVNSPARFGILTNGDRYVFFTDLEEKNKMDTTSFLDFSLSAIDDNTIDQLRKFRKDNLNPDTLINDVETLKYSKAFLSMLDEQFKEPSDDLLRLFLYPVYNGYVKKNVLERFKPIFKDVMDRFLEDKIAKRLEMAKKRDEPESPNDITPQADTGIITTKEEKEGYYIVKSILSDTIDAELVGIKDWKCFCNIVYDNNNWKILLRLHFNEKPWRIGFFDGDNKDDCVEIEALNDIYKYAERIKATAQKYLSV